MKIVNDNKLYEMRAYVNQQDEIRNILKEAKQEGFIDNNKFTRLITDWLVSPTGYVLDTGSGGMVNAEVALRLAENIKKHPILWELFKVA